jgi:hypothetical protein
MKTQMIGNVGCYVDDKNVITFQIGAGLAPTDIGYTERDLHFFTPQFTNVDGYKVYSRGKNNRGCEQIEKDIKSNRLLPRLVNKQINLLYGRGLHLYKEAITESGPKRTWHNIPEVSFWLESWKNNGLESSYSDFSLSAIKRFYFHRDFFAKIRMTAGKAIGRYPIAGMELMENTNCRLATKKEDVVTDTVLYNDFRYVLFGNWNRGLAKFKVYPLFRIPEVDNYQFAAISHHRESSVGDFYGLNETHEGVKTFLKTSNELPTYIDSFLENSLAAKIHVIIPNAWVESKRKQIEAICTENKQRKKDNLEQLTYNGIEVGTNFKESFVIQFMNEELRRFSEYLSGAKNQGKAYASLSFKTGQNKEEERWKIETIDLQYKEYISSLIEYDKRVDEVLISAVGIDSSISAVSKPGMISKSGSDAYYNLIIYLLTLTPDDQKCAEPFNLALQVNFPDIYKDGYRFGYYREIPSRQEEVSKENRLNKQEV